jgi:putative ABC transport system permease protein
VTLPGLALRNAFLRNKTRSFLTVLGVVIMTVFFLFLRSFLGAWYASSEASAADRVVTRNAISLTQSLPISYVARVTNVPGVTRVTWSNWFGGIYKDPKNFFARFAVDAPTALEVFNIRFVEGSKEAWLADRNSCIVGKTLARTYHFKLGDEIPLLGDIYPGEWRFKVAGIVEGTDDESIAGTMYFHYARLNENQKGLLKDRIGVITATIANPNDSPRVSKAIDELFANSDTETHTETEKAFRLQFVTGSGALLTALQTLSFAVLLIIALILANTLAMGLRERTSEVGTMRALGFLPAHVLRLSSVEGALLGGVGGAVGAVVATPLLFGAGKAMAEIGFLSGLAVKLPVAIATVLVAAAIGALAGALPGVRAARMAIVDALRRQE